ncbi:MAG: YchF/TatD family DNA exonuclease [Geobacter sp.]|nr:YchF/TatD family DNA exonuclease [Geobacter sp.]
MNTTAITIIDTHCHLYYDDFQPDWDQMLERAETAGVKGMVVVGADAASSQQAVAMAASHPTIFCTVGIHPHDAAGVTEATFIALEELARKTQKCVAIGEIGLDFFKNRSPREDQERVFRRFLQMARELDKPVVIHDRDAHAETLAMIREAGVTKGVMHCFSGDLPFARQCLDQGLYLSIPGTVTYPSNEQLREVVRNVPLERLLLETDCPYLSPVPHRGKRNEPSYTRITAEKVAELRGLSVEDVGRITTMNAGRLFGIPLWDSSTKIAYRIRNSLYLNITNRCSNHCTFCAKFDEFTVKGHNLLLDHEPGFEEVMAAIGQPSDIDEVVFCGFGESLLRLDLVRQVTAALKQRGYKIRINSDGQANLAHGRNILPELSGLVDSISISLNAPDAATYARLCNTPFGEAGWQGVCDFLREASRYIPEVTATAVTIPGVDIEACRRVAEGLGVQFRVREYAEVG